MILIPILLAVALVVVFLYYAFPLIRICGDSMYPTYYDSQIVMGTRLYRKKHLRKGDVIVYRSPSDGKTVIKRIDAINFDELSFYCLGDNIDHSHDSRHYGFIPSKNLRCKIIIRRKSSNVHYQKGWYKRRL